ncbi:restriction endonuclease subunit S [Faecalibacterium prausnitzii]|uniref:restriction endonuclease subunit S n=1 Tax=Faecalibacterium prausnitzii TaxID=853 RepID=UPI0022E00BA4|nr:restriction endonuclease subunit S [Faecalibacterium prausnitzii]
MARKMKDSGIEWIGEIPEGWEIHRIKTHFSIISGSGFKPELQGQSTGDFPVCKASDISSSGHYLHTSANYITSDIVKSQHFSIIPKGSILFAKIGEAMRKNNRSLCSLDCCVDNNCQGLVPKNISSEFSYYLFTCIDMTWFDNAGTIPCINNQKLYDCRIPFPSYGEQTLIANHLNIQCAKINEMLFHIRSSIEEYKKLKQTVITQAVTKGVRGKREMKDSGVEWIGEIPKEWSTPKIKRLHNGLTDGTHGTFNRIDSGHILLSSKNVREFGIQLGENESFISEADYNLITANGFPQKDDVLLCCIGASIGRCTLYEFEEAMAFQRSVIFIRCNSLILPRMMMYDLRSSNTLLQEQLLVNQSAQAGLYQGLVSEIFISLPPISEQKEIIAYLDAKCAEIDRLIAKKEQLVKELESYKKSLIYEVVTGKQEV